jgi:hypothetical protein
MRRFYRVWCWITRAFDHSNRHHILVLGAAGSAEERILGQNANQMALDNNLYAGYWLFSVFLDWAKTKNPF